MTDSDSLRGDPDRAPRLPPVAELETLRSELARVRALLRGPLTDEGFRQAFDALEDESRRLTNDRHDELQREIGAQAEDLETLRDEVATERKLARAAAEGHDHVRGILLEIAAVFGRVDDLDTLPARQREAVARDNHVRGLLLEIAAVFGSIDDLDTLPARVREAAARGSS